MPLRLCENGANIVAVRARCEVAGKHSKREFLGSCTSGLSVRVRFRVRVEDVRHGMGNEAELLVM